MLQFLLDEATLAEDKETELRAADAAALYVTYFLMPVRFQVGGKDMFAIQRDVDGAMDQGGDTSPPWRELPILHVATVGVDRVRNAGQRDLAHYDVPEGGRLGFRVTGTIGTPKYLLIPGVPWEAWERSILSE